MPTDKINLIDMMKGWEEADAQALIGSYVLVGISHVEADGETLIELEQFHGVVVSVDRERGIELALKGMREGETRLLPPRPAAFEPAEPGEYTLHSTGEVIADPDYTTRWTVARRPV